MKTPAHIKIAAVALLLAGCLGVYAESGIFTDSRDGQKYRTVKIGKLTWMASNLNFKADNSWCYDNVDSNCTKYGRLYNWDAAMNVCPAGWGLPDTADWNGLARAVGGQRMADEDGYYYWIVAGDKLKSMTGWNNREDGSSGSGTDEYGFSAMPGGSRYHDDFRSIGSHGFWWSASEDHGCEWRSNAWYRNIASGGNAVAEFYHYKPYNAFSVRCIQN